MKTITKERKDILTFYYRKLINGYGYIEDCANDMGKICLDNNYIYDYNKIELFKRIWAYLYCQLAFWQRYR